MMFAGLMALAGTAVVDHACSTRRQTTGSWTGASSSFYTSPQLGQRGSPWPPPKPPLKCLLAHHPGPAVPQASFLGCPLPPSPREVSKWPFTAGGGGGNPPAWSSTPPPDQSDHRGKHAIYNWANLVRPQAPSPILPSPNTSLAPAPACAGAGGEPEEDNPFADELLFKDAMTDFQKLLAEDEEV